MKLSLDRSSCVRLCVLAGLLAALVLLSVLPHKSQPVPESLPALSPAPAQDERTLREQAYEKDVAALQKLAESEDETVRHQAAQRLEELVTQHQAETAIEEALQHAGFSSAYTVVVNGAVTVVVEPAQTKNSAMILALCMAHADVGAENVRIMSADP